MPRSPASSIRREMDRVSPLTTLREWTAPTLLLCPPSWRRHEKTASQEASGSGEASVSGSPITAVPERTRNTRSQKPKRPVSCAGRYDYGTTRAGLRSNQNTRFSLDCRGWRAWGSRREVFESGERAGKWHRSFAYGSVAPEGLQEAQLGGSYGGISRKQATRGAHHWAGARVRDRGRTARPGDGRRCHRMGRAALRALYRQLSRCRHPAGARGTTDRLGAVALPVLRASSRLLLSSDRILRVYCRTRRSRGRWRGEDLARLPLRLVASGSRLDRHSPMAAARRADLATYHRRTCRCRRVRSRTAGWPRARCCSRLYQPAGDRAAVSRTARP